MNSSYTAIVTINIILGISLSIRTIDSITIGNVVYVVTIAAFVLVMSWIFLLYF